MSEGAQFILILELEARRKTLQEYLLRKPEMTLWMTAVAKLEREVTES